MVIADEVQAKYTYKISTFVDAQADETPTLAKYTYKISTFVDQTNDIAI